MSTVPQQIITYEHGVEIGQWKAFQGALYCCMRIEKRLFGLLNPRCIWCIGVSEKLPPIEIKPPYCVKPLYSLMNCNYETD